MNKIICIYHRADFDGIFCREIARRFLTAYAVEYIGWDYGDPVPEIPQTATIYMLDISIDGLMEHPGLNWVDHHKSAIEKFAPTIPGYRIDGVAACRLAWQYFGGVNHFGRDGIPTKEDFIERRVSEPLAVRLAGEYDIWDKRDPRAETFQFGLRSRELSESDWAQILSSPKRPTTEELESMIDAGHKGMLEADGTCPPAIVLGLLESGKIIQQYQRETDSSTVEHRSFLLEFEGLKFLALNTARCNSLTFAAKDNADTGHDALMGFYWNGSTWTVSLYHAAHRNDLDLSLIAVKYHGGGHRGACGFRAQSLPFLK